MVKKENDLYTVVYKDLGWGTDELSGRARTNAPHNSSWGRVFFLIGASLVLDIAKCDRILPSLSLRRR